MQDLNKITHRWPYQPRLLAVLAVILIMPLAAACDEGSADRATTITPSPTPANTQTSKMIKIGVDLPLNGQSASSGIPTRNGIQLAIEQANAGGEVIPGYKLEMYALDDAIAGIHNPQQGAKCHPTLVGLAQSLYSCRRVEV